MGTALRQLRQKRWELIQLTPPNETITSVSFPSPSQPLRQQIWHKSRLILLQRTLPQQRVSLELRCDDTASPCILFSQQLDHLTRSCATGRIRDERWRNFVVGYLFRGNWVVWSYSAQLVGKPLPLDGRIWAHSHLVQLTQDRYWRHYEKPFPCGQLLPRPPLPLQITIPEIKGEPEKGDGPGTRKHVDRRFRSARLHAASGACGGERYVSLMYGKGWYLICGEHSLSYHYKLWGGEGSNNLFEITMSKHKIIHSTYRPI